MNYRFRKLQLFRFFLTLPLVPRPRNLTLADEPASITILFRICPYKQPAAHSARPEHQLAKISHFLSPGVQYSTKFNFCIDTHFKRGENLSCTTRAEICKRNLFPHFLPHLSRWEAFQFRPQHILGNLPTFPVTHGITQPLTIALKTDT